MLQKANELKETNIQDYPEDVILRRKELLPKMMEARKKGLCVVMSLNFTNNGIVLALSIYQNIYIGLSDMEKNLKMSIFFISDINPYISPYKSNHNF